MRQSIWEGPGVKSYCHGVVVVLGWLALTGPAAAAQSPAWAPEKAVELISPSSPGGGTDNTVRLLQKIWQGNRLLAMPLTVVNKPGGGQAVSLAYLKQHAADPHFLLLVGGASLLAAHITGKSTSNYTDFTPIALLTSEYVAFAVAADSPIKTIADLAARLRKDSASVSIAVGLTLGGPNHVAAALLARAAGGDAAKLKTVVFKSSSESAVAVLGGHVDLVTSSVSVILPQVNSRAMRILALSAPQRVPGVLAAVPTLKEQGLDVVVDNFRFVMAASGLQLAQIAYWDGVMKQTAQTAEWRKDLEDNQWENAYRDSRDTRKFLDAQNASWKDALGALGMAR